MNSYISARDIGTLLKENIIPSGATRYGLVIGVEAHCDMRLNLRCVRADAKAIYDLMIDPDCGMFPKENVKLLLDADATTVNIWHALSGLRKQAGEQDTVWIYYAGHAAPEESQIYWVTHDADIDDLYGSGLSQERLCHVLGDIHARRMLVLLDCCHASAVTLRKNPARGVHNAKEIFTSYKGKGRVTLASSDGKEKSVELTDVGHGAFTYYLEKGLRGEADKNGDGVVTADELWNYLHAQVTNASAKVGNKQTPVFIGETTHDFALTLNPVVTEDKKKIGEAIIRLIGLGDDKLTTGEAEFCLELLRHGPRTEGGELVYDEFRDLVSGTLRVPTFKQLIKIALPKEKRPTQEESKPKNWLDKFIENIRILIERIKLNPKTIEEEKFLQYIANSIGMKFELIKAGTFSMGSKSETGGEGDEIQHPVILTKDFYLQTTQVTQAQYEQVMGKKPSHRKGRDLPVEKVSWFDAVKFCKKLSKLEGKRYRLPTEAEWEYACCTGNIERFCFGDDERLLGEYAWYWENSNGQTHSVGQRKPNAWGLYDMHGNVWEWCSDWYGDYSMRGDTDPTGPSKSMYKVIRGGSSNEKSDMLRCAKRDRREPNIRNPFIGFRCVIEVVGKVVGVGNG